MTKLEEKWKLTRETVGNGRLSVIMPLYRLAAEAEGNLRAVAALFERHGVEAELVPVDDGSGDGTAEILRGIRLDGFSHVTLKSVVCPRNGGKGAALRAGFEASSGRYVLLLDGDLDINPQQTPHFFEQRALLEEESVEFKENGTVDMKKYKWET